MSSQRLATVYQRRSVYIVGSSSRTVTGLWIATANARMMGVESTDEELGATVLWALTNSHAGVAHPKPDEFGALTRPILELAGVRSWSAFENGARSVQVREDEQGNLHVVAMRPGVKRGFVEGTTEALPAGSDSTALGRFVRRAFDTLHDS